MCKSLYYLDCDTEKLCGIIEAITDMMVGEIAGGMEDVDTDEFYKVADILKDIEETKHKIVKDAYYISIIDAMEKSTDGRIYDLIDIMGMIRKMDTTVADYSIEDRQQIKRMLSELMPKI